MCEIDANYQHFGIPATLALLFGKIWAVKKPVCKVLHPSTEAQLPKVHTLIPLCLLFFKILLTPAIFFPF